MTSDPEQWKARARLELARRGVGKDLADTVLAEVDEHCADSGADPATAFGPPGAFADTVLHERVPPERRADLDRFGLTGGERRSEVIAQLGLFLALAGVVGWVGTGLLIPLTVAGLVGSVVLIAAVTAALYAVHEARAGGRPRAMALSWCVVAVLGVLAALAFTGLPKAQLGVLPAPVITVAGVALLWWGLTRNSAGTPLPEPADAEQWLAQLRVLLVGRHHISRARAAELTAEAAAQLHDTGAAPAEEFGPADRYAVTLAGNEPVRPGLLSRFRSGR